MSKKTRTLFPQSIWDEEAVLDAFETYGINKAHHDKFMRALYDQFSTGKITHLSQYTNPDSNTSPKIYKITQSPDWALMTSKVIRREDSRDKSTTKLLIELQDGEHIETVLMRYTNTQTQEHTRTTICVSSQVGCAQACSFCATGMLGLSGSLTQGEILEQFVWCDSQVENVRNLVFMGQGEPLSNDVYRNVMKTVQILTSTTRFQIAQARCTVSTVGVVDNMYRTIDELPGVTLALSLHAPTQSMRQQIVPSARKYSLKELVDVIDYYHEKTGKKMLIEYVMLDDVNCEPETAHLLGQLLKGRGVLINLIPFNPVLTKAKHIAPSLDTVATFADIVASYGLLTTTRKEFGQDISGACGQLSSGIKKNVKEVTKGYMITDDFTQEEVAVIRGIDNPLEDNNTTTTTPDEDADIVDNGLEGLVSAFGWMNKPENENNENTKKDNEYVDTTEVGVTRETIVDNTTSCGGEPITSPNATVDVEDLLSTTTTTAKPKQLTDDDKIKLQSKTPVCEENCGCHRELKHQKITQGIDPKDVMKWSLAVLSLGPVLKHEQAITQRKKGETERARLKRLVEQQLVQQDSTTTTISMDQCVAGDDDINDEERDHFDENSNLQRGSMSTNNKKLLLGDNLSQQTGLTGISMTSSQIRINGPVSSLKIQPREKDLRARVFIPKKEAIQESQQSTPLNLEKSGWDSTPTTYRHDDDDNNNNTKTTTPSETQPLYRKKRGDDDDQQKMFVLAFIAILGAILAARRMM